MAVAPIYWGRCLCCYGVLTREGLNPAIPGYCAPCRAGWADVTCGRDRGASYQPWSLIDEVQRLRGLSPTLQEAAVKARATCLCGARPSPTPITWGYLLACGEGAP